MVHAELVLIHVRGPSMANHDVQERMGRALTDLRMALQSQPAGALPRCRELVRDMRLNVLGAVPKDMAMAAVSEIDVVLQRAAQG